MYTIMIHLLTVLSLVVSFLVHGYRTHIPTPGNSENRSATFLSTPKASRSAVRYVMKELIDLIWDANKIMIVNRSTYRRASTHRHFSDHDQGMKTRTVAHWP